MFNDKPGLLVVSENNNLSEVYLLLLASEAEVLEARSLQEAKDVLQKAGNIKAIVCADSVPLDPNDVTRKVSTVPFMEMVRDQSKDILIAGVTEDMAVMTAMKAAGCAIIGKEELPVLFGVSNKLKHPEEPKDVYGRPAIPVFSRH